MNNNKNIRNTRLEPAEPPPITRRQPKVPDPQVQADCTVARSRDACEGDDNCEDVCNDVFSSRADKQDCYELPKDLVFEFETLIEATEDGDVEDIDSGVLKCMLDIDEREFAKAIKKMSRSDSKEFLLAVAENDYLADVLESEDDEFNILEQLLYKATGSNNLARQLMDEIEGDKTIVWLAGESNEFAWDWLNAYVNEECESNDADCPGGDNIGAYCNVLLDMNKGDLEDFLSEADLFADEYQDDVGEEYGDEDSKFLYEVENRFDDDEIGDFRDYCRSITSGCGPENTFRITFKKATDSWHGTETVPRWHPRNEIGFAAPIPPDIIEIIYYPDSISDSKYSGLLAHIVISFSKASDGRSADLSAVIIDETEYELKERSGGRQYQAEVTDFNTSELTKHICFKRSDDSYWSAN